MLTYTLESHRKRSESYTRQCLTNDGYAVVFAGTDTTAIVFPMHEVIILGIKFDIQSCS